MLRVILWKQWAIARRGGERKSWCGVGRNNAMTSGKFLDASESEMVRRLYELGCVVRLY